MHSFILHMIYHPKGAALGGGLEIALTADIIVAGNKALFGAPETGLAITTTGQHWYGQEPLALLQTNIEEPLIHPETGLAITTTG